MRRWIALLLLFGLPAQFCWAAAAGYCQHENDLAPQHLGHHEHHHRNPAASATTTAGASPAVAAEGASASTLPGAHADCAYCHFSLAQPLTTIPSLPLLQVTAPRAWLITEGVASHLFERIERPNWPRV